jgi:phosphoribosylglycinamide formyltransferase-1
MSWRARSKDRPLAPTTDIVPSDYKVGFCVSRGGRLARAAIQQASALGIVPSLVVLDHTAAPDLEAFCAEHQVRFARLEKMNREHFQTELHRVCTEDHLDLLVLTFDRVVRAPLLDAYAGRMINVHPALLPAFMGTNALERTAGSGVRFGGATIHEVAEELDGGAIIAQCTLALKRGENAADYGARLFELLRPMFLQTLKWYAKGRVEKDHQGKIWVRGAAYGRLPISPSLEADFL